MVAGGMTSVDPQNTKVPDYLLKIILIGDATVGKTATLMQFKNQQFSDSYNTTIGIDFAVKTVSVSGALAKLQIWDTSGNERFRTITNSYYRGAQGVIIFFSLKDRSSFDNVERWVSEIKNYAAEDCVIMAAGAFCDLTDERDVTHEEVEAKSKELGFEFVEISAKTGENVEFMFERMVQQLLEAKQAARLKAGGAESTMGVAFTNQLHKKGAKSKTCSIL